MPNAIRFSVEDLALRTFSMEWIVAESETLKWIWSKNGLSALQVLVDVLLYAGLRRLQFEDRGRQQQQDHAPDPAFDGQRAEDERGPQRLPTQEDRCVLRRAGSVRI